MIKRPDALSRISQSFRVHPAVALLGPRQSGKTTLARMLAAHKPVAHKDNPHAYDDKPAAYFDLESPADIRRLGSPLRALEGLSGLVIIDEIQRQPSLFEVLRVLIDRPGNPARFLLLGSASMRLVKGVSESLAGRIGFVDLAGFDLREVGSKHFDRLWTRGGFPRSFLAVDDAASFLWRDNFVRTFLERDIPQLGISIPAATLGRFWTMIAHYHGQVWNAADFARSLGTSENTARRHLDILAGAYMVRILPPWFENIGKRQVKAPKIYIRDSGIFNALLHLPTRVDMQSHPKLGAAWEGFALEQVLSALDAREAYFWATHSGAELDLLLTIRGKRFGFEFKYGDAPGKTRSMAVALHDLKLERMFVIYPGDQEYAVDDKIVVVPIDRVPDILNRLV